MVTLVFLIAAAAMIAVALAFVLLPMLRRGRAAGRARGPFALGLTLAFVLPAATLGLYTLVGTPRALDPAARRPAPMNLDDAVAALRAKLEQAPDDLQGWLLLGQAYESMKRPAEARDALARALKLAPGQPDVMVAYAEADSLARPDHRIEGDTLTLLRRAVAAEPDHQRGLWLLGVGEFQADRFAEAAAIWKRLLPLLPQGSNVAAAVAGQIALAEARAGGQPEADAERAAAQIVAAAAAAGPRLTVQVRLDPALAAKVAPDDTLFVYARAASGPPMPLAVAKLRAADLPATVTLTDGMGMTPQFTLSAFPQVLVAARLSKSGEATPQAGDLEAAPAQVDVKTRTPIALVIDRARP
ncbi:MAG: tetratricopeptide repeat protein [Mizugakiibacter sp.]|uniref:tetratricopeptide repeat protein n=1 Tax=Mizugakiibacter sp. TaxID=1972610 RepID=UPI00320FD0B6